MNKEQKQQKKSAKKRKHDVWRLRTQEQRFYLKHHRHPADIAMPRLEDFK